MQNNIHHITEKEYHVAGHLALALRLVAGWTYFSAFWRRLFLANKLDPEAAGYIGEKFNHFLPNALGIKPMIEFLVTHPDILWWAMAAFTIIEGVVGLLFIFGLFTRLMAFGVMSLATGILLGSGWIGTTCLDEWQIGVLGMAAGFTVFFTGSGRFSLDYRLFKNNHKIKDSKWFRWLGSGSLPIASSRLYKAVLGGSLAILFITLFTNQYFHGGVWGTLHNKSVKPKIEIADVKLTGDDLSFQIYRVEGADVYGSFLIGIHLVDGDGNVHLDLDGAELAKFPGQIQNQYIASIKPGAHSLVVPLGAKATLTLLETGLGKLPKGNYRLVLTDISGITWTAEFTV